ncbi:acylphosphatase [Radiobacillus sp. PE A8.2]|uniref:acylphosphatase n=1 Tax=Radiobacillus sp. PE A8.2 TaxID=3380349 RepID=UPI00388D7613
MLNAHIIVTGMVQGVGFRFNTQQLATEIGVNGWVRNLNDGSVEIEVEGETEDVEDFIEAVKEGPSKFIMVHDLSVTTSEDIKGYTDFEIKL